MSAALTSAARVWGGAARASAPVWLPLWIGIAVLYAPTFVSLWTTHWVNDDQAHGPIVLALALWMLWREWPSSASRAGTRASPAAGFALLVVGGLSYAVGRSQGILILEIGSFLWVLAGCMALTIGTAAVRRTWFAFFLLLFLMPMPGAVVNTVTLPMKLLVSYLTEHILYAVGYPIAREGVILQIGYYQLLVADACAGIQTVLTLEAMGLLYLNLVRHASALRNITLALLIVPISITANVIRVVALTLITFHLGDEAGQGFLHGFAGMVLFVSALALIIATDTVLRTFAVRKAASLASKKVST